MQFATRVAYPVLRCGDPAPSHELKGFPCHHNRVLVWLHAWGMSATRLFRQNVAERRQIKDLEPW